MNDDFNDVDLIVRPNDKVIGYVPGRTKVEKPSFRPHLSIISPVIVLAYLATFFKRTSQYEKLARVEAIAKNFRNNGWFPERPEHEV